MQSANAGHRPCVRAGWPAKAVSVLVLVVTFYAGSVHVRNRFGDLLALGINGDGDMVHGLGVIFAGLLMWLGWFSAGMPVRNALVTRYTDIKPDGSFDWRRFAARAFYGMSVGWAYMWSFGAVSMVAQSPDGAGPQAFIAKCAWIGAINLLVGLAVKYYVLRSTRADMSTAARSTPQATPPPRPVQRTEPTL
jgi:hypothetical protein